MKFDFDPKKSEINKDKHGIDFEQGQAVYQDPNAILDIAGPVKDGETYFMAVGSALDSLWAMIYVYRGEQIRIVSIRKARDDEKEAYESV